MSKEYNVSCMKYRTSTHLAGVDIEEIIDSKGKCILTIAEAYYDTKVEVNGKKLDGYFIHFAENGIKPWKVNSTNRKSIAKIAALEKGLSRIDSIKINNWVGLKIELYFDPNVKMKGEVTGGARVKEEVVKIELKEMTIEQLPKAIDAVKDGKTTLEAIKRTYKLTEEQEKALTI